MKAIIGRALVSMILPVAIVTAQAEDPVQLRNLPAQRIGANDLLALNVYGAPELTRSVRVSSDGTLRLPMLRQLIKAEGAMPGELETRVAQALAAEQILVDPVVTVSIVEYHSRPVSVAGAVRKPTNFQAVGEVHLLDAITKAEGLAPEAGPEILVTQYQPGPGGEQVAYVRRIPVKGLMETGDLQWNVRLVGGEEIRVPEVGKVFVVGNVKRPGSYPVADAEDTTLLKMLALSEGLAPFASKQAFIYRRDPATGAKNEIPIEMRKIMERKISDIPLQANDVLYVPDNRTQRIGLTALEKIIGFGAITASGVLIQGAVR